VRTPNARSGAGGWRLPGYAQQRELGRGDSGRVVAAVEQGTGRQVAIRYLSPALAGDAAFMAGFQAHAQQLTEVDVPSAVRVYEFVEQPGAGAAVVMELVSGISLATLIERTGPLPPEAALTVLKGILLGLAAAHRLGFGHGDCRPGNVLVDEAGQVKLTDFGVLRPTAGGLPAAGSPRYRAPEVWRGEPATSGTDLYAATVVFYECLAGHPPFDGDPGLLRELHTSGSVSLDGIDEPLRQLIAEGMAPVRADRPHSAIAFVSELEALAPAVCGDGWEERGRGQLAAAVPPATGRGHRGVPAGGSSAALSGVRRPARRRLLAGAAAVLVIAAVAVVVALAGAGSLSGVDHQVRLSGAPSSVPASASASASATGRAPTPTRTRLPASPGPSVAASVSPGGKLLTVTNDAPADAQVGAVYSGTVTVSGGSGGYLWAVTGLPPGLTASPAGPALTVSGTPLTGGAFTAEVVVNDTARPRDAGTIRLTFAVAYAPLQVSGGLGTAIVGQPYSAALSAAGGNGNVRWRVSGLPRGITATPDGDTLLIAGTPAATGDFPVTVRVSDTESPAQTGTGRLVLVVDPPAPQTSASPTPTASATTGSGPGPNPPPATGP
jgi:eukaryotic-like serine/threonine-protein kinase